MIATKKQEWEDEKAKKSAEERAAEKMAELWADVERKRQESEI
jgi:hypothetical protein